MASKSKSTKNQKNKKLAPAVPEASGTKPKESTAKKSYAATASSFTKNFFNWLLIKKTQFQEIVKTKKEERLTIMFIPHNERSIKNYHISNLTLTIIVGTLSLMVIISSILIINHTSTVQEVDKLKISQKDAKIQFAKIRQEIKEITGSYSEIRESLSQLYGLAQGKKNDNSLFGQGGVEMPAHELEEESSADHNAESIPIEIFMLNRILNDMEISEKPLIHIEKFIKKREKIIKNTPTLWPVQGYIVNPFGFVRSAHKFQVYFNNGIDIAANPGAEVSASAPGVVMDIGYHAKWHNYVRVRHNYGYVTIYKGLERVSVSINDKVTKGDVVGYMGHPADSLEPILHYEIHIGVDAQNPLPYLTYIDN